MRVKVTQAFGPYSVGHIIEDMPANQAGLLIRRGLIAPAAVTADKMMRPANAVRRVAK